MRSSFTHSTKRNGPVPTGCLKKSSPYFRAAVGLTIDGEAHGEVREERRVAALERSTTVESSTAAMPCRMSSIDTDCQYGYGPPTPWTACGGFLSRWRSSENTTAAALNGVPSWNFTPWRRWNV